MRLVLIASIMALATPAMAEPKSVLSEAVFKAIPRSVTNSAVNVRPPRADEPKVDMRLTGPFLDRPFPEYPIRGYEKRLEHMPEHVSDGTGIEIRLALRSRF